MFITCELGPLEQFDRDSPPKTCVYSPDYGRLVRRNAEQALAALKDIRRLYNVFPYQDEPFHAGPKSFGYNARGQGGVQETLWLRLAARHRFDPQRSAAMARRDQLPLRLFSRRLAPDCTRRSRKSIPDFKVVLTHDSHNTLGGGCGSNAELAVDDVFHWGGDFADMFVFDIYPYMMFDFRFGEPSPAAQAAHQPDALLLRPDAEPDAGLRQGVGLLGGDLQSRLVQGFPGPRAAGEVLVGARDERHGRGPGRGLPVDRVRIPADARHWESFGEGLRLIQRAGGRLLGMPKLKARACMLFPRTQMSRCRKSISTSACPTNCSSRAFGELDILHEEQVKDDRLDGYQVLVLFDVTLLPADVAKRIASFVEHGGVVIADCVPQCNAYKQPMTVMEELFGVTKAKTDRVRRTGHWVPG